MFYENPFCTSPQPTSRCNGKPEHLLQKTEKVSGPLTSDRSDNDATLAITIFTPSARFKLAPSNSRQNSDTAHQNLSIENASTPPKNKSTAKHCKTTFAMIIMKTAMLFQPIPLTLHPPPNTPQLCRRGGMEWV